MVDDLLNSLLGGAGEEPQDDQAAGDPLADLLGGLLGGGTPGDAQGAGDMGDMLGTLLGGTGGAQGAGDMGSLLGAFLGSGDASAGAASPLAPMVSGLTEKLGLPPEVAQMVVSFVLDKLLSGARGGGAVPASRSGSGTSAGQDLDDLVAQMSSGKGVDAGFLESTGMTNELSQQTGLDPDTAAASLQEVFDMMGGQFGAAPSSGR
jgi:hypothetical protein